MARCPSCNKFAPLTFEEPEEQSAEVSNDGQLSADVRIVRNSECCGDEMKEYTFSFDVAPSSFTTPEGVDQKEAPSCLPDEEHEFDLDGDVNYDQVEEGGGRYAKSFFGVSLSAEALCEKCGTRAHYAAEDKVAASEMEELN